MQVGGSTIALTGATGFLGSHIALALVAAGARVRGAVRSPHKGAWLRDLGVELVAADLTDEAALLEAFRGADAVVANAALSSHRGGLDDFERVNHEGTGNVLRAASAAGVTRFVQISTVAVYRTQLFKLVGEDAPQYDTEVRRFNWTDITTDWRYSRTKTKAERLCWEHAAAHGLALTALRPGPIYGSRDRNLSAGYLANLKRRIYLAPTAGVPQVHAGDVADAVVGALRNDASAGRAYNLAGPPTTLGQVMRILKRLNGSGPMILPVPVPVKVVFDTSAAERDLGFSNRSLEAGLAELYAGGAGEAKAG